MIYTKNMERSIFESVHFLNESELEILTEGFAISKFIKKLEEIKNNKPNEYSGNEEIKKFVDKNYNDIKKVAQILENEPKEFEKDQIRIIASFAMYLISVISTAAVAILTNAFIPIFIVPFIAIIINAIVTNIRASKDSQAINEITKIRKSLKKVQNKEGLDENSKRKIASLIEKIDDAETEWSEKIKVST